jgi:hypothetical protein
MSLESVLRKFNQGRKVKAVLTPREDQADTRVQVGDKFFHARNQRPGEDDERYAHYLEPHLAELA